MDAPLWVLLAVVELNNMCPWSLEYSETLTRTHSLQGSSCFTCARIHTIVCAGSTSIRSLELVELIH